MILHVFTLRLTVVQRSLVMIIYWIIIICNVILKYSVTVILFLLLMEE